MRRRCILLLLGLFLVLLFPGRSTLAVEAAPAQRSTPSTSPDPTPRADCDEQIGSSHWMTTSVDLTKSFMDMRDNSLALESDLPGGQARPHVAYGNDHLYYAYHDGENWHIETVDAGLEVGIYASLELDTAGRPHIAYYDRNNDALKYAHHDGTAWQLETVDADDGMC